MAVFDMFPMPHVARLIERIGKAWYITTLDLTKGYWQIPVAKRDHAFETLWGLYELIRMPFKLYVTAAMVQHLMDRILAPYARYATAYIDDIVVFTQTWAQHKRVVSEVLSELQGVNP